MISKMKVQLLVEVSKKAAAVQLFKKSGKETAIAKKNNEVEFSGD